MSRAIDGFLTEIRKALFGKDVREAIASGIEQCYDDVEEAVETIDAMSAELIEDDNYRIILK